MKFIITALVCLFSIAFAQPSSLILPSTASYSFQIPSGSATNSLCFDAAIRLEKWILKCGTPNANNSFLQNLDIYCAPPHTTNCTLAVLDKIGIDLLTYCPNLPVVSIKEIIKVIGLSKAICFNYSGHYCINYATKLAELVTAYAARTITLQNATAQLLMYCDSFCPIALRRIAVRLAPILDLGTRLLLSLPSIACWTIKTDYCLFKLVEYLEAAEASNWTSFVDLACHPCMRYLLPLRAILVGTPIYDILALLPDYRIACQKMNNVSCLKIILNAINISGILQNCPGAHCLNSVVIFNSTARCCARTVLPFLAPVTALELLTVLKPGPLCQPLQVHPRLRFQLWLQNVNWTILQQKWSSLKSTVAADLSNLLSIDQSELPELNLITSGSGNGKRQTSDGLSATVDPTGTAYDSNDLNNLANTFLNSIELASLNQGTPGLATDPSGVAVSGGSSVVENPSSSESHQSHHSHTTPSSAGFISVSMLFVALAAILSLF